jgi:hypothetical protein
MPKVTISNINLEKLMPYQKVISNISSKKSAIANTFNAHFIYHNEVLYFYKKDSMALVTLLINATIDQADPEPFGFKFDSDMFFYILSSYKKEQYPQVVFEFGEEDTPFFKIISPSDTIDLPCGRMEKDSVQEAIDYTQQTYEGQSDDLILSEVSNRVDFLQGILECSSFVSKDDKVFNPIIVYKDKLFIKEGRMIIYEHSFLEPMSFDNNTFFFIHKKAIETIKSLMSSGIEFSMAITLDLSNDSKVYIATDDFSMIVNNSFSKIIPPDVTDLEKMVYSHNTVCTLPLSVLYETCSFFSGFFESANDWNPIAIDTASEIGLVFSIKSAKSDEVKACNVKRKVPTELTYTEPPSSVLVSNNYLNVVLNLVKEKKTDPMVELRWDDVKKSLNIVSGNKKAFLAKMIERK